MKLLLFASLVAACIASVVVYNRMRTHHTDELHWDAWWLLSLLIVFVLLVMAGRSVLLGPG